MTFDKDFVRRLLPHFTLLVFVAMTTVGAFTGGLWASLGIGFALLMFCTVWALDRQMPVPESHLFAFILVFLATCALLNFYSSQPQLSWPMLERLATIFLPLSLLTSVAIKKYAGSRKFFPVLACTASIGALALGAELALHGPILNALHGTGDRLYEYNRGMSYLVVFAFPILAALWFSRYRIFAIFFICALLFPAGLTESRAAKLALVLALVTVVAGMALPAATRVALRMVPFAALGWPFAAQNLFLHHHEVIEHLPPSWQDRTEIWDYMSYRIFDRPLLGWGLGTSYTLPNAEPHGALYHYSHGPASHPHNAVLQLWVELGIPGLVFGVVISILILEWISRLRAEVVPFAQGAWVAAFCLMMISYNLWTDSLWACVAVTAFAFAVLSMQIEQGGRVKIQ